MNRMPDVFACASDPQTASQETSYMVIVGPLTLFPGADSVGPEGCRDGLSNTLLVVETANSSVTWTEPIDLSVAKLKLACLGVAIDKPTDEQTEYLSQWRAGT